MDECLTNSLERLLGTVPDHKIGIAPCSVPHDDRISLVI